MRDQRDIEMLRREKYGGAPNADMTADIARLESGEPLAYVIGTQPFLGLTLHLDSRPLIPRPETEWWAELLCMHIGERPLRVLDLCAGSGAIGLAVLKHCPNARVFFGELVDEHTDLIHKNLKENGLDASRADIRAGDLFTPFKDERFDLIAANPPYIPETRALPSEVAEFEPREALYAGPEGLAVIERILGEAPVHLVRGGELWLECDIANIETASSMALEAADRTEIRTDTYGRPRLLVAYY